MSENILEVKNLTKSYEKGNIVLNNISFSLKKGEVVVVIGPSGCGKSTFLRCLNRLEEIDSGTISLNGKEISTENNKVNEIREKIGMVFQSYELFPNMNIMKNLILAPTLVQKRNKEEVQEEAEKLLDRVGLLDKKDPYPAQLSGGQKQRTACARALITNPKLILADEPTGALDSRSAQMLIEMISSLNKDFKATILMVTHDSFTASYCDRILFIKDGKIFTELVRGNNTRKQFFNQILDVVALLGGDVRDVR